MKQTQIERPKNTDYLIILVRIVILVGKLQQDRRSSKAVCRSNLNKNIVIVRNALLYLLYFLEMHLRGLVTPLSSLQISPTFCHFDQNCSAFKY